VDALAIGTLLGGVGLFLLGMGLMTDSLTSLGGHTLRAVIKRLMHRRSTALATGAVATALVQSSSVTTLMTVGFVSAGLVTFSESLGLILGANIGTTSTGWIVSLIGLKFKVNTVALPLVGVGALLKLFTRGRRARMGLALSGFGLVFVGIDVMQQGMAGMDIDLTWGDELPGPLRTLALVLLGMVMTVVMQSSSAAVATTLVALHAGTLDLNQAATLVVGQNVGTTVTAILAATGGSLSARRTAVAHTLFNVLAAGVALLMLRPFLGVITEIGRRWVDDSPEVAIALFHTGFNLLGVLLVYPWLGRFARLVERMVPRPTRAVEIDLPRSSLSVPAIAIESARRGAVTAATEALRVVLAALRPRSEHDENAGLFERALALARDPRELLIGEDRATRELAERLAGTEELVSELARYVDRLRTGGGADTIREDRVQLLHAIDHVRRLLRIVRENDRRDLVQGRPELLELAKPVVEDLTPLLESEVIRDAEWLSRAARLARDCSRADRDRRDRHRVEVLTRLADGKLDPEDAADLLAASRWIGKVSKHAARAFAHLAWTAASPEAPSVAHDVDRDPDDDDDEPG
jgi:phosphate:Na+ symporter